MKRACLHAVKLEAALEEVVLLGGVPAVGGIAEIVEASLTASSSEGTNACRNRSKKT
jgi:hypothetical protein